MTQVTSALMESTSAGDEREVLVRVEGVSKKFCRSLKKSLWYGVQDIAAELVGRSGGEELRADEFWAIKDVSFELRRGECLGLIGRNGAGKSTLLRMLNGLIKPDQGRIEINGKVGGLIALGAGFNPVLTGRENVYVNGSILGLSKGEIDAKLEEIIEFAEIGEFMDAPVQTYSSGMSVRLGFAVAAVLIQPDVLLLDEVLAVGDVKFRTKCYRALANMRKDRSFILVSHDSNAILALSSQTIYLEQGKLVASGEPKEVISLYESRLSLGKEDKDSINEGNDKKSLCNSTSPASNSKIEYIKITSVNFIDDFGNNLDSICTGSSVALSVSIEKKRKRIKNLVLEFLVHSITNSGQRVLRLSSKTDSEIICLSEEHCKVNILFPYLCLKPGVYFSKVYIYTDLFFMLDEFERYEFEVVENSQKSTVDSIYFQPREWKILN